MGPSGLCICMRWSRPVFNTKMYGAIVNVWGATLWPVFPWREGFSKAKQKPRRKGSLPREREAPHPSFPAQSVFSASCSCWCGVRRGLLAPLLLRWATYWRAVHTLRVGFAEAFALQDDGRDRTSLPRGPCRPRGGRHGARPRHLADFARASSWRNGRSHVALSV